MKVNEVIERHGLEFREVSRRMGMKPSALQSAIDRNLTIKTLRLIASAIGCSMVEFFIDELSKEDLAMLLSLSAPAAAQPAAEPRKADALPFGQDRPQLLAPGQCACPRCGAAIMFTAFALAVEQPEDDKKEVEHEQK